MRQALDLWSKHRVSRVAAALSFYMVFSLAPLVFLLVITARIFFGQAHALHALESQIQPLLGEKGTAGVDVLVRAAERKIAATPLVIGAGLVLVAVFAIFMQIQEALDDVWGIPEHKRGGAWEIVVLRLHTLVLVGALAVFALLALLTADAFGWAAGAAVNVVSLGIFLILTYRVLPRASVGWKSSAYGAAITGSVLLLGEAAISLYFKRFHPETAYGTAGSFVIILIWIYYSTQLFLFGAVLTRVFED